MSYNTLDDNEPRTHHPGCGAKDLRDLPLNSDVTIIHKDGTTSTKKNPSTFEDIQHDYLSHYGQRGQAARKLTLQKE